MDYRRMLMEDFSLSPEIVLHCRGEIEAHCSGLHRKGRTLHCLMRVGREDMGTIDNLCQKAVSSQGSPQEWCCCVRWAGEVWKGAMFRGLFHLFYFL